MSVKTVMRTLAFGAVLLAAGHTAGYAQEGTKAPSDAAPVPPHLTVAPTVPKRVPEAGASGGGKPANICEELVAFIAQQAKKTEKPTPEAQQSAPTTSSTAKPPAADEPQQKSGIAAPVPPPKSAERAPTVTIEEANTYLQANDLLACQEAAKKMRRAGVVMPDGLIALAALRPELLKAALEGK
jgi:hypothetical protein